jgi:hypothetical protein
MGNLGHFVISGLRKYEAEANVISSFNEKFNRLGEETSIWGCINFLFKYVGGSSMLKLVLIPCNQHNVKLNDIADEHFTDSQELELCNSEDEQLENAMNIGFDIRDKSFIISVNTDIMNADGLGGILMIGIQGLTSRYSKFRVYSLIDGVTDNNKSVELLSKCYKWAALSLTYDKEEFMEEVADKLCSMHIFNKVLNGKKLEDDDKIKVLIGLTAIHVCKLPFTVREAHSEQSQKHKEIADKAINEMVRLYETLGGLLDDIHPDNESMHDKKISIARVNEIGFRLSALNRIANKIEAIDNV